MQRFPLVALGLAALLVPHPIRAAVDDGLLDDGFETGLCAWSGVATDCVSETELEQALDGETLVVCIPPESGSWSGGSYTACGTSTCADGVTPGCAATADITNADADYGVPGVILTLSGDDLDAPLQVTPTGNPPANCTLQVRDAAATAGVDFALNDCHSPLLLFEDLATVDVSASATFSIPPSSPPCFAADAVLGSFADDILTAIEDALAAEVADQLRGALVGRFLCLGPN